MTKDLSFDSQREWRPGAFETQEAFDNKLFEKLANSFRDTFNQFFPMPYGFIFDTLAVSSTGKLYAIEHKERKDNFDKYRDCFIEPEKLDNIRKFKKENSWFTPLYINYKGDNASRIYIWDLSRDLTLKFHPKVKIEGKRDPEDRYGLQWNECTILELQPDGKYKIIQKF